MSAVFCRKCRAGIPLKPTQRFASRCRVTCRVTCRACGHVFHATPPLEVRYQPAPGRDRFVVASGIAERRDCTVRALALVCGMDYADARAAMALACGRETGKGCWPHALLEKPEFRNALLPAGIRVTTVFSDITYTAIGLSRYPVKRRRTLGSLLAELGPGRYYFLVRGHAFGLILSPDGTVTSSDLYHRTTERVHHCWRIELP